MSQGPRPFAIAPLCVACVLLLACPPPAHDASSSKSSTLVPQPGPCSARSGESAVPPPAPIGGTGGVRQGVLVSPYTFVVTITVTNPSADIVRAVAPIGTLLASVDDRSQVLVLMDPLDVAVPPGESSQTDRLAFCLDRDRAAPSPGTNYRVLGMAPANCVLRIQGAWAPLRSRGPGLPRDQGHLLGDPGIEE